MVVRSTGLPVRWRSLAPKTAEGVPWEKAFGARSMEPDFQGAPSVVGSSLKLAKVHGLPSSQHGKAQSRQNV
jgi:hypothetical protein